MVQNEVKETALDWLVLLYIFNTLFIKVEFYV